MTLLSRFKSPIIYIYPDQTHIHIIFKNLDLYSIPFQPKSMLFDFFKWSDLKNKTAVLKLGEISYNDTYPSSHFATLTIPSQHSIHVVGGYVDNSFRLVRNGQFIQTIRFHTVIIRLFVNNSLETCYHSRSCLLPQSSSILYSRWL